MRDDCRTLMEVDAQLTGAEPYIYGPSIVLRPDLPLAYAVLLGHAPLAAFAQDPAGDHAFGQPVRARSRAGEAGAR
ncbi:MAG: hypothetical protein IPO90_16070 [Flavobacteriales bacterium]|nr:hypothetical protein [Flavobacteriales bacterium]